MATVVDVLETRLDLTNLPSFIQDMGRAGGAVTKWATISAGAAAIAVKSGQIIGSAFNEAAGDAEAFSRASGNFKGTFPVGDVEEFSSEMQRLTAVADDQVAGFLGLLGTFKLTGQEAKSLALPILNASRALEAQGVTVESLTTQVGKAIQGGNASALRRAGIYVDEAKFAVDRLGAVKDALEAQGGNAALEFPSTARGSVVALRLAVDDLNGALGKEFLPTVTGAIKGLTGFVNWVAESKGPVKAVATALGTALVLGLAAASTGIIGTIVQLKLLKAANDAATTSAINLAAAQAAAGAAGATGVAGATGKAVQATNATKTAVQVGTAVATTAAAGQTGKAIVNSAKLAKDADNIQRLTRPINSLTAEIAMLGAQAAPAAGQAVKVTTEAAKGQAAGTAIKVGAAIGTEAAAGGIGAKIAGLGVKGLIGTALKALGPIGYGLAAKDLIGLVPTGGNEKGEGVKTVLGDAAAGAGIGGTIGALVGGVGAVPGALIGGAIGAVTGAVKEGLKANEAAKSGAPRETEAEKLARLMEEQNKILRDGFTSGKAVNFAQLSIVQQRGIMDRARQLA